MFADSAYEFLERVWMKYSVLIGMHGGSMKAEKRWERVDAIPDCKLRLRPTYVINNYYVILLLRVAKPLVRPLNNVFSFLKAGRAILITAFQLRNNDIMIT